MRNVRRHRQKVLRFPLHRAQISPPRVPIVKSEPGEVLIVDADAPIQGLIATLVRRLPRRAVVAADGESAMKLLSSREFDAVIMDLFLAGVSGSEILAYIGRTDPQLLPRVIIVTTLTTVDRSKGELASVAAVLRKPFAIDELQRVLRACCDGRKKSGDQ
jgi:DNA-binding response OmpR family regulator